MNIGPADKTPALFQRRIAHDCCIDERVVRTGNMEMDEWRDVNRRPDLMWWPKQQQAAGSAQWGLDRSN